MDKEKILENHNQLLAMTKNIADKLIEHKLIKGYKNHGLVFNLELLKDKPLEEVFERFLYNHGLSAGLWNEGGSGLLIIVPLTASSEWFLKLETRLINALTDYRSSFSISN
jgi:adenosylmethionine-8-amino-7-oxononanoate aminotransferase